MVDGSNNALDGLGCDHVVVDGPQFQLQVGARLHLGRLTHQRHELRFQLRKGGGGGVGGCIKGRGVRQGEEGGGGGGE